MKRLLSLLLLPFIIGACATGGSTAHLRVKGASGSDIPLEWLPLAEGKRVALERQKPILVDFYVPEGCGRCDRMAKHLYNDPEIARYIEENFILVRINIEADMSRDEIELGRRYDYNYSCLLVFLNYRGDVIGDAAGQRMCFPDFVEPAWFKKYLSRAVEENGDALREGT